MKGCAVVVAIVAVVVAATSAVTGDRVLIAAHRGGAALNPENSLAAFRHAITLGADVLEFDLHLTRDGGVIVLHDATLDRTTTAAGAARNLALADLASVRLKTREGVATEERVPTFAQVLDLARRTSVELLPEIKVGADGAPYAGIEEKVLDLVRARGLLTRVTIQASQPATIRRLHELEPALRTMLLVARGRLERERASPPEAVRWAQDVGASDLGMDFRMIDQGVVTVAREAKIRLSAWTVNGEPDIIRMLDVGVDIIISDRPDLALRLRGR